MSPRAKHNAELGYGLFALALAWAGWLATAEVPPTLALVLGALVSAAFLAALACAGPLELPPAPEEVEAPARPSVPHVFAGIRCFLRHHHNPVRHPLGGFRCADCGYAGADLDEMGFRDGGYVPVVRRTYQRVMVAAGEGKEERRPGTEHQA